MISIPLDPQAEAILKQGGAFAAELPRAIARGLDKGAALALGEITRSRFTGQGPFAVADRRLGVRTNRLRSSLRWTKAAITGEGVVAGSMGSNVKYAGAHEFGFSGSVSVPSHTRQRSASQFAKAGDVVNISKIKGKKARQAALGTETVRAHQRVMNIPERAPLRTGLTENVGIFTREISAAIVAAWERRNS